MNSKLIRAVSKSLFKEINSPVLSLHDIQLRIKTLSRQTTDDVQIAVAEEVITIALRKYWQQLTKLYQVSIPFGPPVNKPESVLSEHQLALSEWLGETIGAFPVLEAAYRIGLIYTSLLPSQYRTKNGIYYTPPALANRLLDQAETAGIDWKTCKVLDPACGGSAFLLPTALRIIDAIKNAEPALKIQNLEARLFGWEVDPFAAWLSRFFIEVICLPESVRAGRRINPSITTCDSLKANQFDQQFDLVIGNPPFGRVGLPKDLRTQYHRGLYGHANLYGLFTELAVQVAKPNGLISFITPASYLAGEYFKNLRALLWHDAPPVRIDFVENRKNVFEGVLQETVLSTYRKNGKRRQAVVSSIRPTESGGIDIEPAGRFEAPDMPTAPWILPRSSNDTTLSERMRSMPHRLIDWGYKVSTGPLVWNRHKNQLRDKPGENCVPLIWAESVTSEGRFVFRSEKRTHKPYFFLRDGKDDWLRIDRPCVLLQRTTAKEQQRRLIAAVLPADFIKLNRFVTVENHLNMIIPLGNKHAVSPTVLAAFLNSSAADRAFRCLGGSVAVSAYELENLPFPDPVKLDKLKLLIKQRASREAIEESCRHLYGLEE
ncbi:MAG: Eco57I restriction-modification methylase domain-containing protein [Desulfobacterales bacterium]|nr:Eco57I restriction-modification methylase domain-containing protein [Desulfobacterales bacterium]